MPRNGLMATNPKARPHNRKRQHSEANLSQDNLPSVPPKKLKSIRERHSSSKFPPPEFWDSLSKVWLTPRALRELDRRNQSDSGVCTSVPTPKPVHQLSSRKHLRRFARHGGPQLGDLRGYLEPTGINLARIMSSKHSKRSSRSSHSSQNKRSKSTNPTSNSASETSNTEGSKRRSSAYDADFEQHLVDNKIYIKGYEYPGDRQTPEPEALEGVRQSLAAPRPSLSPSRFTNSDFRNFVRANDRVIDEGEVMRNVLPILCGDADIPSKQNLLFTRLESMTNNCTVDAQPDFYDGAQLQSVDREVRNDLGPYIIPTKHPTAPVAPNFFIEAKAPKGGADVAKRQACYDGAVGARAMHQLQSYAAGEPVYDNKAYTLASTYHNGQLLMYATHPIESDLGNSTEYHMSLLGGWTTIGSRDQFVQGATALRNGRDWAKEHRDQFISNANERAKSINTEPSTLELPNCYDDSAYSYPVEESQTSIDEFGTTSFTTSFTASSFAQPIDDPNYEDLSDIPEQYEEDRFSANELALDSPYPLPSKKHPSKGSEKTTSKAARCSSHRKYRSRK